MRPNNTLREFLPVLFLAGLVCGGIFLACTLGEDEKKPIFNLQISEKGDSIFTCDSVLIEVHSQDGRFTQEIFHGALKDRKQVLGIPLDPRVGDAFTTNVRGYKNGRLWINKEITVTGPGSGKSTSRDLPLPDSDDPEIQVPADTLVSEGDSLHFQVTVSKPWGGITSLSLKDAPPGATLDTARAGPGAGYFVGPQKAPWNFSIG